MPFSADTFNQRVDNIGIHLAFNIEVSNKEEGESKHDRAVAECLADSNQHSGGLRDLGDGSDDYALDVEPVVLQVVPALRDDRTYHRKLGDRLRKIGDLELEAAQDA